MVIDSDYVEPMQGFVRLSQGSLDLAAWKANYAQD